jgi:hypothetical protein
MDKTAQAFARWAALLAAGLACMSALASGVALVHMLRTAQRGVICGLADGGHCWACYAAPVLAYAAIVAWGWSRMAPRPVRARP